MNAKQMKALAAKCKRILSDSDKKEYNEIINDFKSRVEANPFESSINVFFPISARVQERLVNDGYTITAVEEDTRTFFNVSFDTQEDAQEYAQDEEFSKHLKYAHPQAE